MKKFIVLCSPIPTAEHVLSEKQIKVKALSKEDAKKEVESQKENDLYLVDEIIELAS